MEIVTVKKETWKLPVVLDEEGDIAQILQRPVDGVEFVERDNFVFSANLVFLKYVRSKTHAVQYLFKDEVSGVVVRFSPMTVDLLMRDIQEGRITVAGGFRGNFTFGNFAGNVYAKPLSVGDAGLLDI